MAAIMERDPPPPSTIESLTPPAIDRIVARCLSKDPDERWQSAADLAAALAFVAEALQLQPSSEKRRVSFLPWALAVIAMTVAAVFGWLQLRAPAPATAVTRFGFPIAWTPSSGEATTFIQQPNLAISPDGKCIVYTAKESGRQRLFVRRLDEFESHPLPGTEDGRNPFFSPDGQSIAFLTSRQLKRLSLETGAVATVCDVLPLAIGGTWLPDDTILFTRAPGSGLMRVAVSGGEPAPVSKPAGRVGHLFPRPLPGARTILVAALEGGWFNTRIGVISLDSGEYTPLLETGTSPHYLPTGHLLYVQAGAVHAVRFDPGRLELSGTPVKLLEGVLTGVGAELDISDDGTFVYLAGGRDWLPTGLVWVDRSGNESQVDVKPANYDVPRFSPVSGLLSVNILNSDDGNRDVWLLDPVRGTLQRVTSSPASDQAGAWTPGGRLVTGSQRGSPPDIFWRPADLSSPEERILAMPNAQFPSSVSPDGRTLLFTDENPDTNLDIWRLSLPAGNDAEPWIRTALNETAASFSPNGHWVAYQSDESGRFEIYVRAYPGGAVTQISSEGGTEPVWAPDGRELFYRNGPRMMAVTVGTGPHFQVSRPVLLFEGPYSHNRLLSNYAVDPDTGRFLMVKPVNPFDTTELRVVRNWLHEIHDLLP